MGTFTVYCFIHTEQKTLKKYEKVCKDHDYCCVKMPHESKKNIKIQPRRKVINSFFYYLFRLRLFAWKNRHMSR